MTTRRLLSNRFAYPAAQSFRSCAATESQQRFVQRFSTDPRDFEPTNCPCGEKAESWLVAEIDRYGLPLNSVMCGNCGTIRFDPYLTEGALECFYTSVYQGLYARSENLPNYFERQRRYGEKIFQHIAQALPAGAAVLEIGCGAGGALQVFQEQGCRVAGFDYAAELVDFGDSRGVGGLGSGSKPELFALLEREHWDFIYLHHVFEHVGDPQPLLVKIREVLRPYGSALIIVPDIFQVGEFVNPAGDVSLFLHIAHKYNYSLRGLQLMAAKAGLTWLRRNRPSLSTAWSTMPELWLDLVPRATAPPTECDARTAEQQWRRLRRTETCYRLGMCSGQWKRRWGRITHHFQRLLGNRKHDS